MLTASLKCWFTESLSVKCLSHHFNAGKYVSNGIMMNNNSIIYVGKTIMIYLYYINYFISDVQMIVGNGK